MGTQAKALILTKLFLVQSVLVLMLRALCCALASSQVFCWRSLSSSLKPCRWAYPRQVSISDIALNRNEILFVTQDGEGFKGKWFEDKRKNSEKKGQLV